MFWSPDGREIAFFSGNQLKRISVAGGAAIMICRVPAAASNGTWSSDGTILFASLVGDGIFRVSSAGGTPASIVTPDASLDEQVVWPSFLPDGKRFLYLSQRANSTGYIMLSEPGGRAPRPVTAAISNVQWIEPGYLVFAQEGVLVAQRFEDASGQISGPPIPIAERVDLFLSTGRALFTASRTGTIAYDSFANVARLEWIDRQGRELGTVAGAGNYLTVRLSRDDRTALFQRTKASTGTWDVYTADLTRGVETQVTLDPGSEAYPVWMPDERRHPFRRWTKRRDAQSRVEALRQWNRRSIAAGRPAAPTDGCPWRHRALHRAIARRNARCLEVRAVESGRSDAAVRVSCA